MPRADSRSGTSRAGELILTAQAKGHAPDLKKLAIGQDRQPVEFRLGPGQTIRGRIIDVHDKPIAGAPIAVDAWRGHHSLKWSTGPMRRAGSVGTRRRTRWS